MRQLNHLPENTWMSPTDIAKLGLNKTQILEHLPKLKTKQLVVEKRNFTKKTKPGNYFAITPLGTLLLFKEKLDEFRDNENALYTELERIKKFFPCIDRHWDNDLEDCDDYRYVSLLNALDNFEVIIREKHYISFAITLNYQDHFVTFEKDFGLVITEEDESNPESKLFNDSRVKPKMVEQIEKLIKEIIVMQFYYHLKLHPESIKQIIKKTRKKSEQNKGLKDSYSEQLKKYAKKYEKELGHGFDFNNDKKLESKIIEVSDGILQCVKIASKKDRDIQKITKKYSSEMRDVFSNVLRLI